MMDAMIPKSMDNRVLKLGARSGSFYQIDFTMSHILQESDLRAK